MMITIITKQCPACSKPGTLEVDEQEWKRFDNRRGPLIQVSMPSLTPEQRDQVLFGLHVNCSADFYGPDPENEDEF